jgi:hypothetical protein
MGTNFKLLDIFKERRNLHTAILGILEKRLKEVNDILVSVSKRLELDDDQLQINIRSWADAQLRIFIRS